MTCQVAISSPCLFTGRPHPHFPSQLHVIADFVTVTDLHTPLCEHSPSAVPPMFQLNVRWDKLLPALASRRGEAVGEDSLGQLSDCQLPRAQSGKWLSGSAPVQIVSEREQQVPTISSTF